MLKDYSLNLKDSFSNTENIDLQWLKFLMIITTSVWIIAIFLSLIFIKQRNLLPVYNILFVILTIIIFLFAFFGFRQSTVFFEKNQQLTLNKKYVNPITGKFSKDVATLKDFMRREKAYLNPNLTIKELASMLNWQPQHLSRVINEELDKNFYEFINYYRVEEFKLRILNNKKYTILAVAFESGFNSKSSFNRIFKQFTGLTPSQYIKSVSDRHK